MLWCGNYCSVSFKSSVLHHLVIAPVPNSITPNITLQKKSAHSDWSITHLLFAHGWMVMKASTCSKPCAPFSTWLQHVFFYLMVCMQKKVRFLNIIIPPVIILQSRDSKDSFPYHWHIIMCQQCDQYVLCTNWLFLTV